MGNSPVSRFDILFPMIDIPKIIHILECPTRSYAILSWKTPRPERVDFTSKRCLEPNELYSSEQSKVKREIFIWVFFDGKWIFLMGNNLLCFFEKSTMCVHPAVCYIALAVSIESAARSFQDLTTFPGADESTLVERHSGKSNLCLSEIDLGHDLCELIPIFSSRDNVVSQQLNRLTEKKQFNRTRDLHVEVYSYTGKEATHETQNEAKSHAVKLIRRFQHSCHDDTFSSFFLRVLNHVSCCLTTVYIPRDFTGSSSMRCRHIVKGVLTKRCSRFKKSRQSWTLGDSISKDQDVLVFNEKRYGPRESLSKTRSAVFISEISTRPLWSDKLKSCVIANEVEVGGKGNFQKVATSRGKLSDFSTDQLKLSRTSLDDLFEVQATHLVGAENKTTECEHVIYSPEGDNKKRNSWDLSLSGSVESNFTRSSRQSASFSGSSHSSREKSSNKNSPSVANHITAYQLSVDGKSKCLASLSSSPFSSSSEAQVTPNKKHELVGRPRNFSGSSPTVKPSTRYHPAFMLRLPFSKSPVLDVSHETNADSATERRPNKISSLIFSPASTSEKSKLCSVDNNLSSHSSETDDESENAEIVDLFLPSPKRHRGKLSFGKLSIKDFLVSKESKNVEDMESVKHPQRILDFANSDLAIRHYCNAFQAARLAETLHTDCQVLKVDTGHGPGQFDSQAVYRYRDVCSEIIPGARLYISGAAVAGNTTLLKNLGITHIINLAGDSCSFHSSDIRILTLVLHDNRYATAEFESLLFYLLDYISECLSDAGHRLLINCREGVSRSSSVAMAYIMWKVGISFQDVLDLVRYIRPCCNPNTGFTFSLLRFQKFIAQSKGCTESFFVKKQRLISHVIQSHPHHTKLEYFDADNQLNVHPLGTQTRTFKQYSVHPLNVADVPKQIPLEPVDQRRLLRLTLHNILAPFVVVLGLSFFDRLHRTWMPNLPPSLDPRFCYILRNDFHFYLWLGAEAVHKQLMEEIFFSEYLCSFTSFEPLGFAQKWTFTVLEDGQEPDAFWNLLNGVPDDQFSFLVDGRRTVSHDHELDELFSWMIQTKELYNFEHYVYRSSFISHPFEDSSVHEVHVQALSSYTSSSPSSACSSYSSFSSRSYLHDEELTLDEADDTVAQSCHRTSALSHDSPKIDRSHSADFINNFNEHRNWPHRKCNAYHRPFPYNVSFSSSIKSSHNTQEPCSFDDEGTVESFPSPSRVNSCRNQELSQQSHLKQRLRKSTERFSPCSFDIHGSRRTSLNLPLCNSDSLSYEGLSDASPLSSVKLTCVSSECSSVSSCASLNDSVCDSMSFTPGIPYLYKWPNLDQPIRHFCDNDLSSYDLCIIAQYNLPNQNFYCDSQDDAHHPDHEYCPKRRLKQNHVSTRRKYSFLKKDTSYALTSRTWPIDDLRTLDHSNRFQQSEGKQVRISDVSSSNINTTKKRKAAYSFSPLSDHSTQMDDIASSSPTCNTQEGHGMSAMDDQLCLPKDCTSRVKNHRSESLHLPFQHVKRREKSKSVHGSTNRSPNRWLIRLPTVLWVWRGSLWIKSLKTKQNEIELLDQFKKLHGITVDNDIQVYWEMEGHESREFQIMLCIGYTNNSS